MKIVAKIILILYQTLSIFKCNSQNYGLFLKLSFQVNSIITSCRKQSGDYVLKYPDHPKFSRLHSTEWRDSLTRSVN